MYFFGIKLQSSKTDFAAMEKFTYFCLMMLKRIPILILIIMSTFYIDGCKQNNDDAIKYFEDRYFAVEKMIDLDNQFQEELQHLLTQNPEDTALEEERYFEHIQNIESAINALHDTLLALKKNKLPTKDNDFQLDKAYQALLNGYIECVNGEYHTMVGILKEEANEVQNHRFKTLYQSASDKLNASIHCFYEAVDAYAEGENLEIELDN
jgi:hypothetical protein